jgi:ribosomal protein L32
MKMGQTEKKMEVPRTVKCPTCGQAMFSETGCGYCKTYHEPQKCTGEGCKICAEIKSIS